MRFVPAIPLLLLLSLAAAFVSLRGAGGDFLLGGIQVNEPDHAVWLATLEEAGMNTVAVTVYARQGDWDSANLWFEEEEPWVVAEAAAAKARGLNVVLVLRVALDHAFPRNRFLWHGMIQPRTEPDLDEWFRRYRGFALRWAAVAAREGIDVLAIGSELNSLTSTVPLDELPALEEYWSNPEKVERERRRLLEAASEGAAPRLDVRGGDGYQALEPYLDDRNAAHARWALQVTAGGVEGLNHRRRLLEGHWLELIEAVREVYPERLTYAANFDQYEFVSFWGALDLLSINAYFPLLRRYLPEAGPGDLEPLLRARWTTILRSIDALRRRHGLGSQGVLFSELGYVQRAHATVEPWSAEGVSVLPSATGQRLVAWREEPADPTERALAVRALYDAHLELGGDLLAGLLYWKLSTVPSHREVEPFVLVLGDGEPEDPLLTELRRFVSRLPVDRLRRRLTGGLGSLLRRATPAAQPGSTIERIESAS